MSVGDESLDTGETLTEETAVPVFASLLSDEEKEETDETQPTQQSPESEPESDEVEASTEQAQSEEGESEEIEQTDEEQTEESVAAALDPNTLVKVKVNGEERQIPLAEALRGYSRTEDYTRKTQELSVQRKTMDETVQALRGQREQYAAYLAQLEQAQRDLIPQEPDWVTLQAENPQEFATEWARWSQLKERMSTLRQEREQAEQAVVRDRQAAVQEYLKSEREKLIEAVPEWKDTSKAKAEKKKMAEFALERGFSQEELMEARDHRVMLLLRDAMLYREMKSKLPQAQQKIDKVKVVTPGPAGNRNKAAQDKAKQAQARLAKSGSEADLAAVFLETGLAD